MEPPIPKDWDGVSFCRYAVCWPDSDEWKAILYGLLEMPNYGRFWDFKTGNFLLLRNQFREAYDYNFNLKEVIMACGDNGLTEVATALEHIAIALNAQATATATASVQCCDQKGSGGGGTTAPPYNPTTPGDPETDPPPDGFETWEEFLSDKCAIAWDIVETLQADLGQIALTNLTNIGTTALATILAVALATPIPFDDVIALAAFLLSIAAEVVVATALDILNDHLEELACELYNGTNAQSSRSNFLSAYGGFVDSASVDPVEGFACKTLVGYLIGSSATNRMYIKDTTQTWPPRDCTGCEEIVNCWDWLEDLEGWEQYAYDVDTGTVEWSDAAEQTSMLMSAPDGGGSDSGVTARIPVPEGYGVFDATFTFNVTNGPLTLNYIVWYDDDTVSHNTLFGNFTEGFHPNVEFSSNPGKTATHFGIYGVVGPGFGGFEMFVYHGCLNLPA